MKSKSLDQYRVLLAFLVVAIHIFPFSSYSSSLDILFTSTFCRIAVPIFLMITGYYILPSALHDEKRLINYSKKILKLYFFCTVLYLPINLYAGKLTGLSILEVAKKILFDGTYLHLWYFPSLLLGIWITYFLLKHFKKGSIFFFLFLYVLGLLGDSYYGLTEQIPFLKNMYAVFFQIFSYTRNGFFFVPIFLYLGYYFQTHSVSKKKWLLLFSLLLLEVEGYLLHIYNIPRHDSMYITLLPVLYFLFPFLLCNTTPNKKLRNMATTIYIFHPFFLVVLRLLAKILSLESILVENSIGQYISVAFVTFLFALLLEKMKEVVKK